MNKYIANGFGTILTILHAVFLIFIVFAVGTDAVQPLQAILAVCVYTLVVGSLAVIVSINEYLEEIRDLLKKQTEHET